jgi:hypothetical protein
MKERCAPNGASGNQERAAKSRPFTLLWRARARSVELVRMNGDAIAGLEFGSIIKALRIRL